MTQHRSTLTLILLASSASLLAQDKVIGDAIENLKGTADEARKANPLLATVTGDGVVKVVKKLVNGRSSGTGPLIVEIPKAQLPAPLAKAPVRRVAPVPPASTLPAITPVALLAIQHPTPKPAFTLVEEAAVNQVHAGSARAEVVAALGQPSSDAVVNGLSEGAREVMTYHVTPQRTVAIRLTAGVVTAVVRN